MTPDSQSVVGTRMRRIHELAKRAAKSTISILIVGETGVGKDVLANAIHSWSPRADRPLLPINCSALPSTLVDAELFGHEKGAFTGASTTQPGLLEQANGGTVFLDELGELPVATQAKLLRVVEERIVRPVGRGRPKTIDVRFIAATNRNISAAIDEGTFRADLFYRLGAIVLKVPPLRDRRDEIPGLAQLAAEEATREFGEVDPPAFTLGAVAWLEAQRWPGNIRELKNVVRRACLMREGPELSELDLRVAMDFGSPDSIGALPDPPEPERLASSSLSATDGGNTERDRIFAALRVCGGNQTKAATVLGMPRRTLITRLDHYNFPRPQKNVGHGAIL